MLGFFLKGIEAWLGMEKTRSRFADALQRRKSSSIWSSGSWPVSRRSSESTLLNGSAYGRPPSSERPSTAGSFSTNSDPEGGTTFYCGLPSICEDPACSQLDQAPTSNTKPPIPYYDFQSEQWEDARSDALRLAQLIYSSPSEELIGPFESWRWNIQSSPDGDYNTAPYSRIIIPSPAYPARPMQSPNLIYERHSHKHVIRIEWYDSRISVSNLPRICFFPAV